MIFPNFAIVGAGPLTAARLARTRALLRGLPTEALAATAQLAAGRRQSPRPRGFSKHVVGEQAQIPAASMVDRAARVERHPRFAVLEVAERMPIIGANELVRVAVLIEQAGDLLMIDRLPVVRRTRPLMATRRRAVEMASTGRHELDAAMQTLRRTRAPHRLRGPPGSIFQARA